MQLKKLLFLSFFLVSCGIYNSKLTEVNINIDKDFKFVDGVAYYKDFLFSGKTVEKFPEGTVYKTVEYLNGLKHGVLKEYGFTGARKYKWHFKNGVKDGTQYAWFLEGPKKYVKEYKDGLLHGMTKEWFISGNDFRQRTFLNGEEKSSKVYYNTKELHTNYVKRDNAIYGLKSGELCMDFASDGEKSK